MDFTRIEKAAECLQGFVSEERLARIDTVLARRTRRITIVLEDICRSQNASAVVRTCECLGVQDLHIIQNYNRFELNTDVAQGAGKWVDVRHYREPGGDNTSRCLAGLKERGYQIFAAGFGRDATPLHSLSVDRPAAVCIGTEEVGLSDAAFAAADQVVQIPMYGFTQSFNLSVSAALCMQSLSEKMRAARNDWQLAEDEQKVLRLEWLKKSVRNAPALLRRFGFEDMI